MLALIYPITCFGYFSDVTNLHRNYDAISFLENRQIIAGFSDGTFRPDLKINRAELVKIIVESNDLDFVEESKCFTDVKGDEWYVKYVCTAKNYGWLRGYDDGSFKPSQNINRAEAIKIISKAENWLYEGQSDTYFSDVSNVDWYGKFVNFAKKNNYLPFANNFMPSEFISRGEFAEIYYRILYSKENNLLNFPNIENENLSLGKDYSPNYFGSVLLNEPFPSKYVKDEQYIFSGSVNSINQKSGKLVFFDSNNKITNYVDFKIYNKLFSVPVTFSETGNFGIGIVIGDSTKTVIAPIVIEELGIAFKQSPNFELMDDIELLSSKFDFSNNETFFQYELSKVSEPIMIRFDFIQNKNIKTYYGKQLNGKLVLNYADFVNFQSGKVLLKVSLAPIGRSSIGDFVEIKSLDFAATSHHFSILTSQVSDISIPTVYVKDSNIEIKGIAQNILNSKLYVIEPSGTISTIQGAKDNIRSGETFSYTYTPKQSGVYIFELNNIDGLAAINHPVYPKNEVPIIPDYFDLNKTVLSLNTVFDEKQSIKDLLKLINESRTSLGLSKLKLDKKLSKMADSHAVDMLVNNYVSHYDLEDRSPDERRREFGIKTVVSENLAKVYSVESGHEYLMRSAIHRKNVLNPEWTKVGIAIKKSSTGAFYIVQEFSYAEEDLDGKFRQKILELNPAGAIADDLQQSVSYWNEKMISSEFFSTSFENDNIFNMVDSGKYSYLKSAILTGSNFDEVLSGLVSISELKLLNWDKFGCKISVDQNGDLVVSIIWGK